MSSASDAALEPLPADRFSDRELSWLAFNQRVLELAEDTAVPPLERAKFLAIFASNLDEFYMVRVAGLKRRIAAGIAVQAASGLTPRELMKRVHDRTRSLMVAARPGVPRPHADTSRWRHRDPALARPRRRRAEGDGQAVRRPDLRSADAARRRPGAPVPLHLRAFAQPRRRRAQPEHRRSSTSPVSRCRRRCRASFHSTAASASSHSRTSSPRTSTRCSPAWRCCSTTPSASRATRTSRSKRTRPRTCSRHSSVS